LILSQLGQYQLGYIKTLSYWNQKERGAFPFFIDLMRIFSYNIQGYRGD